MENLHQLIITLFSAENSRFEEDTIARMLEGDYPIRVKSKVLATIRSLCSDLGDDAVVGFYPVTRESVHYPTPFLEDITQDHYGDLVLYLTPEVPCRLFTDLLSYSHDGVLSCREDLVRGNAVIVISDDNYNWSEFEHCLEEAGAESVRFISIFNQQ